MASPPSRLWSEPDRKYAAKLREVAPSADPATRTYLAKFSLPDAGEQVSLGMTATLTLADPATERVARLPLSALFSEGGDPSLYVVDAKGEVALKPVAVKSYESNSVVITAASMRAPRWWCLACRSSIRPRRSGSSRHCRFNLAGRRAR